MTLPQAEELAALPEGIGSGETSVKWKPGVPWSSAGLLQGGGGRDFMEADAQEGRDLVRGPSVCPARGNQEGKAGRSAGRRYSETSKNTSHF